MRKGSKEFNTAVGYICKVIFDNDLGENVVQVYPTEEALRTAHPHSDECGIVEVAVVLRRVVQEIDIEAFYERAIEE